MSKMFEEMEQGTTEAPANLEVELGMQTSRAVEFEPSVAMARAVLVFDETAF